ncbi:SagB/ThcOx family dehydrogenase [Streptomyces roseolilacinus]|uniref:SagB/ThcOx family dehydrogenase n=1 Tax=Streptomyces roseolilacinus TaxID=66904 RepID=UPI003819AC6D
MSTAQRLDDAGPPAEWFVQAALGFHRHSTYGNFPEPVPAGLLPDSGTGGAPDDADAPPPGADGAPGHGGPEELVRLVAGRRSRRTRTGRLSARSLTRALGAALAPDPATGRYPYPSAGGCYAVSLHAVVQDVAGLERGVHPWDPATGALAPRRPDADADVPGILRTTVIRPSQVQAVLMLTADLEVYGARYGERGYRYALLEAGHMGQNLTLALHLLGIANCPVGGFLDDRVARLLHPDRPLRLPVYGVVLP